MAASNLKSTVSVGSGTKPKVQPNNGTGPAESMSVVAGFGSGTPHSSTINAVGGPLGKALASPGSSVRGFTGKGALPGKI